MRGTRASLPLAGAWFSSAFDAPSVSGFPFLCCLSRIRLSHPPGLAQPSPSSCHPHTPLLLRRVLFLPHSLSRGQHLGWSLSDRVPVGPTEALMTPQEKLLATPPSPLLQQMRYVQICTFHRLGFKAQQRFHLLNVLA